MADEITLSTTLTLANGRLKRSYPATTIRVTQSTARDGASVQSIGTTYEAIPLPADVTTPGICRFQNMGATNFVELGVVVSSTFYPFVKLKPGEVFPFRLGTSTPYAKADTAAVDLECVIFAN